MECDRVKEFVKERWNGRLAPETFVHEMQETLTDAEITSVKLWLMDLCGQDHAADPCLLKFLFASVHAIPMPISQDDLSDRQRLGYIRMVIENGDVLFNDVSIGTTESAVCALSTLRLVLQCGSPDMIKDAISKLSRSPYFNILVSSGRVFAKDMFCEVRDLFEANYPQGKDHECAIGQIQLLSALFSKEVNHWLIRHSRQELLLLVSGTVYLWHLKACVFCFFGEDSMHLYHHMLMDFVLNRSMRGAYIVTNLFIRILMREYEVTEKDEVALAPYDRDRVERFVKRVFDELGASEAKDDRVSRFDEVCSPKAERLMCDQFMMDLGRERMLQLLTTMPPNWESPDYDFDHFVDDVHKYPACSSMVIDRISEKLAARDPQSARKISVQIVKNIYDFTILLSTTMQFVTFLHTIATIACDATDDLEFGSLLLVLTSIVKFSWQTGSQYFRQLCEKVFEQCPADISRLLRIGCNLEPPTPFSEDQDFHSDFWYPLPRTLHFFNFLCTDQLANVAGIVAIMNEFPYLWIPFLYWGSATANQNCLTVLGVQSPPSEILRKSVRHLLELLDNRNVPRWLELDNDPDFDIQLRQSNRSLVDLQYWIVYDIKRAMQTKPIGTHRAWSIAIKWRVLIRRFSLELFVKTVIDLLVWTTQSEIAHEQSQSIFQGAAMLFIAVAEDDDEFLMDILRIATTTLEAGSSKILDWYGLAEFCVCLILSMKEMWKEAFLSLMEVRNKILTEDSTAENGKWMFALCLIQIALYIPELQRLIVPDMFEALIVKHNWQTAIDFFIARSKSNQIECMV